MYKPSVKYKAIFQNNIVENNTKTPTYHSLSSGKNANASRLLSFVHASSVVV
jgi:hypothetical protein